MIRATLEVSVLASGFLDKGGVPAELIRSWARGAYDLVLSDGILDGLQRAYRNPYFQRRMTLKQMDGVHTILRARASLIVPSIPVHGTGEEAEDDLVLSTALSGAAGFLVTGDRHLQQIDNYQSLFILSPREFLEVLAREEA